MRSRSLVVFNVAWVGALVLYLTLSRSWLASPAEQLATATATAQYAADKSPHPPPPAWYPRLAVRSRGGGLSLSLGRENAKRPNCTVASAGGLLVVDSRGHLCERFVLDARTHCCRGDRDREFQTCRLCIQYAPNIRCCERYEHCVSCCMGEYDVSSNGALDTADAMNVCVEAAGTCTHLNVSDAPPGRRHCFMHAFWGNDVPAASATTASPSPSPPPPPAQRADHAEILRL